MKGSTVYAIELGWPSSSSGRTVIRSLGSATLGNARIQSVKLLGSEASLKWRQQADRLEIEVPPARPGSHAFVFAVALR